MTLRASPAYRLLAESLLDLGRRRRLIYVRNPGNWGDALIGAGERAFLRHFAIPHVDVDGSSISARLIAYTRLRSLSLRPTILYGGNGALSGPYPELHAQIRLLLKGTIDSVLMPSTLPPDIGSWDLPPSIELWRRDETISRQAGPESRFCHDMAFFLEAPDVPIVEREANLFRADAEQRNGRPIPSANFDLSDTGSHQSPVREFFDRIGRYEVINTDRLHIAIAGALLGRRVNLFPNSYGKNEAIYAASIAPHYPNVVFHG